MGDTSKKYWTGLEELNETPEFVQSRDKEFPQELPVEDFLSDKRLDSVTTDRRDFLKFLGFGLGAVTLAACESPVVKSIPYVVKPEETTPGIANYYASSYFDGHDFASVLVKTREGRPIHINGNKQYGVAGGRTNARINASVLSLYDSARLQEPMKNGSRSDWETVDGDIKTAIQKATGAGKSVRVLSSSVNSPSMMAAISGLGESMIEAGGSEEQFGHVQYDAISASGILEANEESFGEAFLPDYNFGKAKTIVSVAADFLGEWLFSNEYMGDYARNRRPENGWMSNHFQFESLLSLTGTNADVRKPIKPSQEGLVVASIHNYIAKKAGASTVSVSTSEVDAMCATAAEKLWSDKGQSLMVAGSNNKGIQVLVNNINFMLGNYGSTIRTKSKLNLKKAKDSEIQDLIKEMNAGKVGVVIIADTNPAYALPNADEFKSALEKVETRVAVSQYNDETASLCNYHAPSHHYLESWNDYMIKSNYLALAQPTIGKLYNTRQLGASLLAWSGQDADYHAFIQNVWENNIPAPAEAASFNDRWYRAVHDGGMKLAGHEMDMSEFGGDLSGAASAINTIKSSGEYELVVYAKAGIGDGRHANNPWLQELPDPITKMTWDNYVTMAPADVRSNGYNEYLGEQNPATVVVLNVNGKEMKLPVVAVPGQKPGTLGVALGYGRGANGERIGKAAFQTGTYGGYIEDENGNPKPIGVNAYPMMTRAGGNMICCNYGVSISGTDGTYPMATTQTHHTIMDRHAVLRETDLNTFNTGDREKFNPETKLVFHGAPHDAYEHDHDHGDGHDHDHDHHDHKVHVKHIDLWNDHPVENVGHRWGMSIDLNACIGCGACVVSCHSENNVPIVGKDEIRRARDMHWLRIDRYFSSDMNHERGDEEGLGTIDTYRKMEIPSENPKVVHMPMMCQHCNHAPCETVCPVAATTHSNEGLNQMAYNRCIGTRYCANNCPYKVRRFNWFNYMGYKKFREVNPSQDATGRMVLNPDVTVRARGVMEKCSMCVQRIQAGKLEAKKAGQPVQDGAIQTACAEACPTNAITFGDVNDKKSKVRKNHESIRGYYALEEIGTRPNIAYMVKVRNEQESTEA